MIRVYCIKELCPTDYLPSFCEKDKYYHIYDQDINWCCILNMDKTPICSISKSIIAEYFIKIAEYRDKQIDSILND